MDLEYKISLNQYGQGVLERRHIVDKFGVFTLEEKRSFLEDIIGLLIQSKINDSDLKGAIKDAGIKATFTPCVILMRGINQNNLYRVINLPENELSKALALFLSLFKIGYQRRFTIEKNNPDKWWYWDLGDKTNVEKIRNMYN